MVQHEAAPTMCASTGKPPVAMSPRDEDAAHAASDRQHLHGDDAEPFGGSARLGAMAPQLISAKSSAVPAGPHRALDSVLYTEPILYSVPPQVLPRKSFVCAKE